MDKPADTPTKIEFHHIKSQSFRVIHSDGVWGGGTPRGYITMGFYSERGTIPQKITHKITPEGALGDEIDREGKTGIVREMEVEVVVDLTTAKGLIAWLTDHVSTLEKHNQGGGDL